MALPWAPEPLSAMRARYPQAIADVCDRVLTAAGIQPRPGTQRRHVFDFADGVRLIVSRDRMLDGREDICVSGSIVPDSRAHRRAASEGVETFWCDLVSEKWHALAKSDQVLELVGWSAGKGVPHFVVRQTAASHSHS